MMPRRPAIYAAEQRRQQRRSYDRARGAWKKFYSLAAWRRLRRMQLAAEPWCRHCMARGTFAPATQVDHIIDRRVRPDLALDAANLQSLCATCHSRKTIFIRPPAAKPRPNRARRAAKFDRGGSLGGGSLGG
jgi:5-methylcytosine-specific restriction protein A